MIQCYAQRDLGAVIGNLSAVREKLREKVKEWVNQVEALARIAATQPHAAYSAFTLGLRHRWTYLQRTMAPLAELLQPLEDAIRNQFIPALLGETKTYAISDLQRSLFALPARFGGLAIDNPATQAQHKYQESVELSQSLRALIKPPTTEGPPPNDQERDQDSDRDDESPNMNNPEDSKDEDTKSPIPNNQNDGNDLDDNKTSEHPRDEDDPDESQDNKILAIWEEHKEVRAAIKSKRRIRQRTEAERISQSLTATQKRAMELAQRKGASSVYTTLPLTKYGFSFARKRDFRDLIRMRYKFHIPDLPVECACGKPYSLDHSQTCPKGGFIALRHDEPKNLFGRLASRVFRDVEIEPNLDPLSGEELKYKSANRQPDARSDVRVRGFWGNRKDAFFEFRVFNPFASSFATKSVDAMFSSASQARKREYEERINVVDNGSFTPMILASTGGTGTEMSMALKVVAEKLAEKTDEAYSQVMGDIRARFSYAIARSSLVCLRGSRSLWTSTDLIKEHDNCSSRLLMAETSRY
jgi:hypothetical protein